MISNKNILLKIIVICAFFFFLGIFIGVAIDTHYLLKIGNKEIERIKSDFAKEKVDYEKQIEDLTAWKDNRGVHIDMKKYIYEKGVMGVYSPLLEGKNVEVTTYKYKNATIVRKQIEIDNTSRVTIWEYQTRYPFPNGQIPDDFGIFDGYENYANYATSVNDLKRHWTEPYKTKSGIGMYYGYEYTPRTIGVITLSSYHNYFNYKNPQPSVLIISYTVDTFSASEADPKLFKEKEQLNKIANTFELVAE